MLTRIKRVKGFGIFNDYTANADLKDFLRFNLFYGWNGSGKTTLSRLLSCLQSQEISSDFTGCEFEVVLEDGAIVKHSSLESFKSEIAVFNKVFVDANIDWEKQGTKGIVVISEDKIEERNRFLEIRDKLLPIIQVTNDSAQRTFSASEKERDDFLSDLARSVKQSFKLIESSDSRYLNYDRTKLKNFISAHETELNADTSILADDTVQNVSRMIRPIQKNEIIWTEPDLQKDKLLEGEKKIKGLLQKLVVSETIQRLLDFPEINAWVQTGLKLHEDHQFNNCEFCGNSITTEKIQQLGRHFSKEYSDLIEKLQHTKEWLGAIQYLASLPDRAEFYEEYQEDFRICTEELTKVSESMQTLIQQIDILITEKLKNPFAIPSAALPEFATAIQNLQRVWAKVKVIIGFHNQKTKNFSTELEKNKKILELHYVATGLKAKKYFELLIRIEKEHKNVNVSLKKLTDLHTEKQQLGASLANMAKGAEEFNKELASFLGRTDISLQFDATAKGYKIIRSGTSAPAKNLSEGEKTALAFIFFMNKIKEGGRKIKDMIIVIDDPISSFDSNHLFHSFAYLKSQCEEAKQLFILTHNFQYFKMIRDWFMGKNKFGKPSKSNIYTIEVESGATRRSGISNAHTSLTTFGSEYQYLFKKLVDMKEPEKLDIDSAYQVANYSRKLLEGFFKFKHPKERSNFYELVQFGCDAGKVKKEVYDKVFRFINRYSHKDSMDFLDSSVDNLLGESDNITSEVLNIIEACDKTHYDELLDVCAN